MGNESIDLTSETVKQKILIVEDEVITGIDLQKKLQNLGFLVTPVVRYGEDVKTHVEQETPNLILMDINLKGDMNGIEAAKIINESYKIPIIFLTANSDEQTLKKVKKVNPYGYLTKPTSIDNLRLTIEMAFYKFDLDKQLQESEQRFRTVADFTYDWEMWISPDGKIIYISPSCFRVTGYTAEEFIKDETLLMKIVHSEDKDKIASSYKDNLSGKTGMCHYHFKICHKDGEVRWIEHSCQPVYSNGGVFLGRRVNNRDVTVRKELEKAYLEKINELEDALTNIKTLHGLLPICSSCKSIRNDEGYWDKIESYICRHSDAEFSHGLCPDCAESLYSKEEWYQRMKNKPSEK